jgi:heat shock protein HslJ
MRREVMKKILTSVMLSVLIVIGIAGCNAQNSTLEDAEWFLRSYGEQNNLQAVIEDTEITATFNSATGEVSGSAGCNHYFAGYEVRGSTLSISGMGWTEMACISPEGVMEQEQEFLTILAGAQSFQVDDTTLTIFCSGGQQLYFTTAARTQ